MTTEFSVVLSRRSFLTSLAAGTVLAVAPAIVRAASLMPVRQLYPNTDWGFIQRIFAEGGTVPPGDYTIDRTVIMRPGIVAVMSDCTLRSLKALKYFFHAKEAGEYPVTMRYLCVLTRETHDFFKS